eukprot:COSAG03_NODE_23678_length_278_cov_0.569832_1_plen_31_part_10
MNYLALYRSLRRTVLPMQTYAPPPPSNGCYW